MQTYTDGTPIHVGDHLRITRSGGLLPGYTAEGVAAYHPREDEDGGVLYMAQERQSHAGDPKTAYTAYLYINHGGILEKLED